MATLHLIFSPAGARDCRYGPDDVLLLLQEGVYARDMDAARVLEDDARARGLLPVIAADRLVDWDGVVALTEACNPVVSWR